MDDEGFYIALPCTQYSAVLCFDCCLSRWIACASLLQLHWRKCSYAREGKPKLTKGLQNLGYPRPVKPFWTNNAQVTQHCGPSCLEETTAKVVYCGGFLRITAVTIQFLLLAGKQLCTSPPPPKKKKKKRKEKRGKIVDSH